MGTTILLISIGLVIFAMGFLAGMWWIIGSLTSEDKSRIKRSNKHK